MIEILNTISLCFLGIGILVFSIVNVYLEIRSQKFCSSHKWMVVKHMKFYTLLQCEKCGKLHKVWF